MSGERPQAIGPLVSRSHYIAPYFKGYKVKTCIKLGDVLILVRSDHSWLTEFAVIERLIFFSGENGVSILACSFLKETSSSQVTGSQDKH